MPPRHGANPPKVDRQAAPGWTAEDLRIIARLRDDIPYGMEKALRPLHRDKEGVAVPFVLNTCQRKLHALIDRVQEFQKRRVAFLQKLYPDRDIDVTGVRLIIGKCRRGGVSSYLIGRFYLRANFHKNLKVLVMAHKGDNAKIVFRYVQDFVHRWPKRDVDIDGLPTPIHQYQDSFHTLGEKGMKLFGGSFFDCMSAGGEGGGRGDQYDVCIFSEAAHYPSYIEVSTALAACPKHTWSFEESTANGAQGGFYSRWQASLDIETLEDALEREDWVTLAGWNGLVRFFYSWLEEPAYRELLFPGDKDIIDNSITPNETALLELGADYEQLKWRRMQLDKVKSGDDQAIGALTPEQWFQQEFPATPEEMFQESGSSVFDQGELRLMQARAKRSKPRAYIRLSSNREPERVLVPTRSNFRVYDGPQPHHSYVIGADVGYGVNGRDYSVAIVLDRLDGTFAKEAALLRLRCDPALFGDLILIVARWYATAPGSNVFLCPEANGPGLTTCTRIVESRWPHIYHRRTADIIRGSVEDTNTFRFGYLTSGNNKGNLVDRTRAAIREGKLELQSPEIINEMIRYQLDEDDKMSAPAGEHDDCVMATCLAWFGHVAPYAAPPVSASSLRARSAAPTGPDADVHAAIRDRLERMKRKGKLNDYGPGWQGSYGVKAR